MLGIEMTDVINVLNACKPYLIGMCVAIIIALVVIIITFFIKNLPNNEKKLIRSQSWIAALLSIVIGLNLIFVGPLSTLLSLTAGSGKVSEETAKIANELAKEIVDEGIVMLKNDDNALPLQTQKLNVFGWSSINPIYGGTGSGAMNDNYPIVSLLEGVESAGFELNEKLANFYENYRTERPLTSVNGKDWTIPEPTIKEYEEAGIFEDATNFSDTALVVISRSGGEGADLPNPYFGEDHLQENGASSYGTRFSSQEDDLDESKHYLELTNRETAMIDRVNKEFKNVIIVINSANAMELDWLNEYDSIKGALLLPGPGQSGFLSLGEVLKGSVNPSGRTVDTFVADLLKTPTANNFGAFAYDNMDDYSVLFYGKKPITPSFVNYVEGIYVGYKFYETAATEGIIDYEETVVYPFGYGLSYTTFEQKMGEIKESNGFLNFDVTVTNTGNVAGKEVVQIYSNPPYANGSIEKSSVNLVSFDKTKLLEPGEAQVIPISISVENLASYDTYGSESYVLEKGIYEISIREDSHNIIDYKNYEVKETIIYDEDNKRTSDKIVAKNQFDFAKGDVEYLSRKNNFENYDEITSSPVSLSMSDENKEKFINNSNYNPEDYNDAEDEMPTIEASNNIKLSDLRGVDYDDDKWNDLLDQLSVKDMNTLISQAGFQTAEVSSVGKILTVDVDGPAALNNNFTGEGSIGFPSAVVIASTWNEDIAKKFGDSIGQMASEMKVSGWYAPAANIHRSAFSGRNFEYYSEDGFLSGKMASNAIVGAEEHGIYAYMKHFALNDQETLRDQMLLTWANEQSIREIYLKPFEMAVKEGKAKAMMSSFNYIGTRWAGASSELLNTVLRDEWGFHGFVLSDWWKDNGYMNADIAIRNGNDAALINYDAGTNNVKDLSSATSIKAMRQSSKNIMYTVVNSRAYAPENLNVGLQVWQKILIVINVIIGIFIVFLEYLAITRYKKRKTMTINN